MIQKPIQSFTVIKPAVTARMANVTVNFNPQNYASGMLMLFDEDGKMVTTYNVNFTLEEMNLWGEDDNYVLDLALQKVGIQL